jgi:SAM-dependent methyltransferase
MRESLLALLAEPGTGAALMLDARRRGAEGRVEEGALVSTETGRRYPIVRGIPRFVQADNYAASFGMQWNRFRDVHLDSDNRSARSRRRFEAETGWTAADLAGKRVLDAGCGAGRFAEVAAARGAEVVALDYSSAVEAAAVTLARFPNVDVVQASLLQSPFSPGAFDFAYCFGVVQHTPDPAAAVRNVVESVRRGGQFALTIYARKPWTRLNGKYLIRPLTRRLDPETLLGVIECAMPVLFPLTDALYRVPVVKRVARFALPIANWPEHDDLSTEQRYREAVLDTFDALSPRYDSPMTAIEVERVLRAAGVAAHRFNTRRPINVLGSR